MCREERLKWHQDQSGPEIDDLKTWLTEQIEQHRVEPNSSLGEAIRYMLRHWEALTLFLRQPGAPLDKDYVSHCTSLSESQATSLNRRLSDNFCPWFLAGRFSPTGS